MAQNLDSLEDLYLREMREIFNAKEQLSGAMREMASTANAKELRTRFETYHEICRLQMERLEKIFEGREGEPSGWRSAGMDGLIRESDALRNAEGLDPDVLDAGLIVYAQKIAHYFIAAYGSAQAHAITLEFMDEARALGKSLDEESAFDDDLTRIAEGQANPQAM